MKHTTITRLFLYVCAALTVSIPATMAQTYPNKSVRLVVPFPAGSATDQVARLTGLRLQEALGQTFVIDNRPGAQGIIRPEVKDRFAVIGTDVAPMNPEQFGGFIKSEVAKWAKFVKEAGIQPE